MEHPLAIYLAANKLEQKDLAKKVGVSSSTISRVISGATKPGAELIHKIVQATGGGVSEAQLVKFAVMERG